MRILETITRWTGLG